MTWKPLHTWIATVIGVFTLWGLVWASPYRPVLKFEHDVTVEIVVANECDKAERRFYRADREKRAYEDKKQPVPRDLFREWQYRKREMKKWCRR